MASGADGLIHATKSDSSRKAPPTSSSSSPTSSRRPPDRRTRPEVTVAGGRRSPPSDRKTTALPQNQTPGFATTVHRAPPSEEDLTTYVATAVRPAHHVTCADSPCFPEVPCEPTVTGSFRCGRCPYGYTGDGVTCKGTCRPADDKRLNLYKIYGFLRFWGFYVNSIEIPVSF